MSKTVRDWLNANMSFWLPRSPDLNHLSLSFWTHIEEKAYKIRNSNTDELKTVNHASGR